MQKYSEQATSTMSDDLELDPENMLMGRLLRQESELAALKMANEILRACVEISDAALRYVIDSLMEPIILHEIAEQVIDEDYKSYLMDGATVIDNFKMTLEMNKQRKKASQE